VDFYFNFFVNIYIELTAVNNKICIYVKMEASIKNNSLISIQFVIAKLAALNTYLILKKIELDYALTHCFNNIN